MVPVGAVMAAEAAGNAAYKAIFSEAALVIAVIGFLAVIAGLLLKRNRKTYERASRLPLEED
jgi:cbb3-type cytochrome oxidase subunit 3